MSGYIGTQPVPQATQTRDAFTATAGQTSFATSGYTPSFLDVFLNGVKLSAADYTASNGSDVVLASGAALDDILEVVAYTTFDTANVTGADDFTVTGSFTSQGIDDNATSTAMTLDGSGNLLVGKATPAIATAGTAIRGDNPGLVNSARAGTVLELNRLTSDGDIVQFYKDGSTVGSIKSRAGVVSTIILDPRTAGAGFTGAGDGTSNRHIVGTNENGAEVDGGVSLGKAGQRFKDLYLSGGVYLGGTGSANKLDDYEEGLWTPAHSGNTMNGSGYYVKIGRLVTIHADVTAPAGSSSTNVITGLPFVAISTHSAAHVGYTNSASQPAGGYTSVSQIHFIQNGTTSSASIVAGDRVIFSALYFTDA